MCLMKILIYLFIFSTSLYGQDFLSLDLDKPKIKTGVKQIDITIVQDTAETASTLHNYRLFDIKGNLTDEYMINSKGDTLTWYHRYLTDTNMIFSRSSYDNSEISHQQFYNQYNNLESETYDFGGTTGHLTNLFLYNGQNLLIRRTQIYDFGTYLDTLVYEGNLLQYVLSYKSYQDIPDSTAYLYNSEKNVTEMFEYDDDRKLSGHIIYTYNSKGECTKRVNNNYYFSNAVKNSTFTKISSYHPNGQLKKTQRIYMSGDEKKHDIVSYFDTNGNLTKMDSDYPGKGKVFATCKITYY